jgi:hypothetical protein
VTRVCVIGNSHAACFKLAWDTLQDRYPNETLTFFAARGFRIAALEPRDGQLFPTSEQLLRTVTHTSGGRRTIDPNAYDVLLIIGLNAGYPQTFGHYSYAVARQALLDQTPSSMAVDLIQKVRQVSDIPILLAHQPLPRHDENAGGQTDPEPYRRIIKALNDEILRDQGAILLEQPASTRTHCFFTRPEFAVGSKRLDIGDQWSYDAHREDQRTHMNANYGAIYLSTHLPTIAAGGASPNLSPSSSGT